MKIYKRTGLTAFLVISFFFMQWYIHHSKPTVKKSTILLDHVPDQKITGLKVSLFNPEGQLTHQLKTPLMTHVPNEDQYWFEHPRVIISEPNQPSWKIQSLEATATHQMELVTFNHHVQIRHSAFQNHPSGLIQTETLHYYPRAKKAITKDPISWLQASNTIHSQGMTAYLDQQRIDLNEARATYAPQK